MFTNAQRLYVGQTLVYDAVEGGDGVDVVTAIPVVDGVGDVDLAEVFTVKLVQVDAPVRIRFYSTVEGRSADLSRSVYSPYPGDRCLAYELNATGAGVFDVPFLAKSPLFWAANAAANITLTWRSIS